MKQVASESTSMGLLLSDSLYRYHYHHHHNSQSLEILGSASRSLLHIYSAALLSNYVLFFESKADQVL